VQSGQQQGATALVDVEMACHWHSKRKRKHSPRFPLEQQGSGWQALRNSIRQMSGHMNVGVRVYRMARYKSAGQVKGKGKSQRHLTLHMPGSGWGRLIGLKFWLSWCCWSRARDEFQGLRAQLFNISTQCHRMGDKSGYSVFLWKAIRTALP